MQAIQRASPLPAPPKPEVYANALALAFSAEPFREGAAEEGYEPDSTVLALMSPQLERHGSSNKASAEPQPNEEPIESVQ